MKTAIIVNALYYPLTAVRQAERIRFELEKLGETVEILKNDGVNLVPNNGFDFDKCVFLDKDVDFCALLECGGVRCFNPSRAIELADDKGKTVLALAKRKGNLFGLPKTVIAPKIYRDVMPDEYLKKVSDELKFPMIVKESVGSFGAQVSLVYNLEELAALEKKIGAKRHIYQELIEESVGRSLRVYVVGGKVAGAMRLTNTNDFRSNFAEGGKVSRVSLDADKEKAAIEVAAALNLDFAGVDLFDTELPLVIEVNSNAYFEGLESLGYNIAEAIAKFVVKG